MSCKAFLANENIPLASVRKLRLYGYDVESISENFPGISDFDVLKLASDTNRIILTFDRDYGKLVFKYRAFSIPGVVLFRFVPKYPEECADILIKILNSGIKVEEMFTVVDRLKIRQRKI